MLLNNEWVNNDIKEEIKKFLETNQNEHTTVRHLWDTAQAVLIGKFIATQGYLQRQKHFTKQPSPISRRTGGTTNRGQSE